MKKSFPILILSLILAVVSCSWRNPLIDREILTPEQAEKVLKVGNALRKGFHDLTEEEEYYIGRAVASHILSKYGLYQNDRLTNYINCVGMSVVYSSDRPEVYRGYHFAILDSDEMVAFAAPGGFVFISRGMLKTLRDEEGLAGVLAHEVAHINQRHGLKAIKQSRLAEAFIILAKEVKSEAEMEKLTRHFEGVLEDIIKTLIEKGYSREQEYEADRIGTDFTSRAGYNPDGLKEYLITLKGLSKERRTLGLFKTHPDLTDRIVRLDEYLKEKGLTGKTYAARSKRFKEYTKVDSNLF